MFAFFRGLALDSLQLMEIKSDAVCGFRGSAMIMLLLAAGPGKLECQCQFSC